MNVWILALCLNSSIGWLRHELIFAVLQPAVEVQGHGLDPGTTDMWFAGKRLERNKLLQDYLGANEKTKAIVKLQEAGGSRPAREPVSSSINRRSVTTCLQLRR